MNSGGALSLSQVCLAKSAEPGWTITGTGALAITYTPTCQVVETVEDTVEDTTNTETDSSGFINGNNPIIMIAMSIFAILLSHF